MPEIQLHPKWQLLYAQLTVLLQREFNLSLMITTHSPYFLDAIDVFSTRYHTSQALITIWQRTKAPRPICRKYVGRDIL